MEGQADRVGAGGCDIGDILLGDVILLEGFPERVRLVGADEGAQHVVDEVGRIGFLEAEHVTLRIEPVPQVGPLDQEGFAVSPDERRAVDADESRLFLASGRQDEGREDQDDGCRSFHRFVIIDKGKLQDGCPLDA